MDGISTGMDRKYHGTPKLIIIDMKTKQLDMKSFKQTREVTNDQITNDQIHLIGGWESNLHVSYDRNKQLTELSGNS